MRLALYAALAILLGGAARADEDLSPPPSFLGHSYADRFWFSGQANVIFQAHPGFPARYSGEHSLRSDGEVATSALFTLYTGMQVVRGYTEILLDGELAAGGGLSSAFGLAGFTNLDVVRNPSLGSEPYLARVELHQIIPLSRDWEKVERGPLSTFGRLPRHRIEIRVGKLSTADVFDQNGAASDSHLQFMNWTVDNNGAWDYAADTRGYTYGLTVEYDGPRIEVRLGELLMPTVANGIDLDWDLAHSRGENVEVSVHYLNRPGWQGTLRALGYVNHANMGSYREAIDAFLASSDPVPDITLHRRQGRIKYGFGLNLEQTVFEIARLFARGGYNDGATESFAYTEVDDTFELGFDLRGDKWRRPDDKLGLAFVTNGLSALHRDYLALGGLGFLLGDGALSYGRENILETYYNIHLWKGFFGAADIQFIDHPGYNRDRGPVWVFSLRAHIEL